MKILISNDGAGAHLYIRLGLARAFTAAGHECVIWDIHKKPVFDAFDEFEPDIFFGQTYNMNRALATAIYERPHMKVIMKAADWGPLTDPIDTDKYPVVKVSKKEKRLVLDLYNKCRKPDYLHIYYHPDWIEQTHGGWINAGIPVHSHMNAADIIEYTNGTELPEFRSDVTFVGGYWPYKAQILDKWMVPLAKEQKARVKIFGGGDWPSRSYCGSIDNQLVRDALRSATVCPNLHEPHSQDFGYDINERTFKLLSNKCFVVSDSVEGAKKLFHQDEVAFASNPEEFKELVYHYVQYPDERLGFIHRGYNLVMDKHTYFNRAADIFQKLGFQIESQAVLDKLDELRKRIENENTGNWR